MYHYHHYHHLHHHQWMKEWRNDKCFWRECVFVCVHCHCLHFLHVQWEFDHHLIKTSDAGGGTRQNKLFISTLSIVIVIIIHRQKYYNIFCILYLRSELCSYMYNMHIMHVQCTFKMNENTKLPHWLNEFISCHKPRHGIWNVQDTRYHIPYG